MVCRGPGTGIIFRITRSQQTLDQYPTVFRVKIRGGRAGARGTETSHSPDLVLTGALGALSQKQTRPQDAPLYRSVKAFWRRPAPGRSAVSGIHEQVVSPKDTSRQCASLL